MDIKKDIEIIQFIEDKNLSPQTLRRYLITLNYYSKYTNLTPTQLINEAEKEESEGIKLRRRTIKKHLTGFKNWLIQENYSPSYIKNAITIVRIFYNNADIQLPRQNSRNILNCDPVKLEDLPSKHDIQHVLSLADVRSSAIILLMSSSGMGSAEIRSLTVDDFFKSIETYVNGSVDVGEISSLLKEKVEGNELVMGTWHITRVKTSTPYTTFSTYESIEAILLYLKTYPSNGETKLFRNIRGNNPLDERGLSRIFNDINALAKFGNHGRQIYFRSHNLRKFFTNTLYKNKIREFSIKWLLGRKIGSTDDRYFKTNIEDLKEDYIQCIPDLSMKDTEVDIVRTEDKQRLIDLEEDNRKTKKDMEHLLKIIKDKGLIDEFESQK